MSKEETIAELRSAAKHLRATDSGSLMRRDLEEALADLLDIEAAMRGEMEPFADFINAAIETQSGVKGYIRFGRKDDGEISMIADAIEPVLAVARIVNGVRAHQEEAGR